MSKNNDNTFAGRKMPEKVAMKQEYTLVRVLGEDQQDRALVQLCLNPAASPGGNHLLPWTLGCSSWK